MAARFLWFDTEYSSTVLETAGVLQAALIATDEALAPIVPAAWPAGFGPHERREHGVVCWVKPRPDLPLSDFVRAQTALLEGCAAWGRPIAEVDALFAATVDAICGPSGSETDRPILAGNSVHLDWLLARRELPRFASRLHWRILDVTTLKLEWAALGGPKLDKDVAGRHDAYHDVRASIAELAHYRRGLRIAG